MKAQQVQKWGIDIGNVLIQNFPESIVKDREAGKLSIEGAVDLMEEVPGGFDGFKYLLKRVGPENVWIVSKASALQEQVSRLALRDKFPIMDLGFDPSHYKFCLEKIDKAPILKELGIQGHIDDRGEVITSIQNFVQCPIWFHPEDSDYESWRDQVTHRATLINSWSQLLNLFEAKEASHGCRNGIGSGCHCKGICAKQSV